MTATASITREEGLAGLAVVVGGEHARVDGDAIRVSPANAEEIALVLRFAKDNGLPVVPTGSGTKLGWGNAVAAGILLSLERMNAVREHSWHDLTCTVQAGCSWAAMQAELARHGQMVALDPLWPARATVGGVVATNDSGAWRLRYGGMRDLVIGMTLVLADGTIAKTGGKVVKNVAGYDLHKLLIGSFGTLGVVAEVNFRLHPAEQHARTWTVAVTDAAELAAPLGKLLHAQLPLTAVQLRVETAALGNCNLDVRISTRPECFDEMATRMRAIFGDFAMAEGGEDVWQARAKLFGGDSLVVKASMLPAETCAIASELKKTAMAQELEISLVAQATGLMTIALRGPDDATMEIVEQLRRRLGNAGGSVTVLQMSDGLRARFDAWDCRSDALPVMREIKRRFDPSGVLSPGRFVGGI
jgi:glycolate oxidase FAD binding subunit